MFDLPPTTFREGQYVSVSQIHIKWSAQVKHAQVVLTSTLIDKSSVNPHQQLLFIYEKSNSNILHKSPTQRQYYKIQCMDLQSSEFYLFDYEHKELKKIDSIFIQLEILDERIKPITQKTSL